MIAKKLTKAQLEQKVRELKAGSVINHSIVYREADKFSTDHMMASGVILTLTSLGGKKNESVLIQDGLSVETIKAIKADILRSQKISLSFAINVKS